MCSVYTGRKCIISADWWRNYMYIPVYGSFFESVMIVSDIM